MKEFKNRWYLIAYDVKKEKIKTYSIDRLRSPESTNKAFNYPDDFNVKEYFKYSFGIISSDDIEPQYIYLSFDAHQGKYIKSLPLHESQQIIKDNAKELIIRLHLCITFDFVKELLSFGSNLRVLSPKSLFDVLKKDFEKSLSAYCDNAKEDVIIRLNKMLEYDKVDINEILATLTIASNSYHYFFNLIDLQTYSAELMKKVKDSKLEAVKSQNFELASSLRHIEKEFPELSKMADIHKMDESMFYLVGNQLYYFCTGLAHNDVVMKACYQKITKEEEGQLSVT